MITTSTLLCSLHFDERQYENKKNARTRLINKVVPTRVFVADGTLTGISNKQRVVRDPDPETTGIDFNLTSTQTEVSKEEKNHDSQYGIIQWTTNDDTYLPTIHSMVVCSSLSAGHEESYEGHPEGNEHDPLTDDSLQLRNGDDPLNDDSLQLRNGDIVGVDTSEAFLIEKQELMRRLAKAKAKIVKHRSTIKALQKKLRIKTLSAGRKPKMGRISQMFFDNEIANYGHPPSGRRFTKEVKMLSMRLAYHSTSGFNEIRQ